jgi:hypothetical protein
MCATCYSLRRQDEEHFGGLRERVLEGDGYRCRVCDAPGTGKRSVIVHHRVPGRSELKLMISLCPACHARVHRTNAVLVAMPPLILVPWREQHPKGHEQRMMDFDLSLPAQANLSLFQLSARARPQQWVVLEERRLCVLTVQLTMTSRELAIAGMVRSYSSSDLRNRIHTV